MSIKIFLDANVLLDFLLKRKQYQISKRLIKIIEIGDLSAYVTPSVIHIVSCWLGKAYNKDIAKKILLELLSNIRVIDCNHDITINALMSDMSDIEDALQYYTAIHHQMDYFISHDKDLIKATTPILPIISPSDFLSNFGTPEE